MASSPSSPMASAALPMTPVSLETSISVETPEQIALTYSVAGIGSRAAAALIDYLICAIVMIVLMLVFLAGAWQLRSVIGRHAEGSSDTWIIAIAILLQFVITWGYYVLFEGLADGQTPGKRLLKLRVVRDGGYSVTFAASAIRNIVRVIDGQPFPTHVVGMFTALFNGSNKRLGDFIAGTIVVKESAITLQTPTVVTSEGATGTARPTAQLTDEEYTLLERYMTRRSTLAPEYRARFTRQLTARFAAYLPPTEHAPDAADAALLRLFEMERDARATGVASRSDTGARREHHAIVAFGLKRWNDFGQALDVARKRGLRRMSAEEVSAFVSQYREITSDLARLQTATRGRSSDALFYVSRLVARGHNLLYRQRSTTFAAVLDYITYRIPREIRRSWVPIAISAVLLFGPAVIAYTTVVRTPSVAPMILPDEMLSRAELGRARATRGEGYVTIEDAMRPVAASAIISNNVQVTYAVFAFGITAGIGTVLMLVFNGVSIGGAVGLFASKGIADLILAFMAPHGVLELFAICVAAGGGLLLGAALLFPGERTRREALVENGRRAITLIAGSTLLLVVAGTIEGLISPRVWPISWKLGVSAATAVALVAYLSLGSVPEHEAEPDTL